MNYEELIKEIVLQDERFVVLTAENRAAIRNLPDVLGIRFIDTGISEQTLIGTAAGLALRGRIPIVHALAAFLTMRAFEFIRTDIGVGKLVVKLVGAVPGFLSDANGPTHQAIEDISIMRGIPGMNIFCPADEQDMILGLPEILKRQESYYIRYNNLQSAVNHKNDFEPGKAELISDGFDVTILTYGILLQQALDAKDILNSQGISVRLINLRTLKPIDEEMIIQSVNHTPLIVTLEDHFKTGGLYSIVSELFVKNRVMCKVIPIALENRWFKPALLNDVLKYEGFTGEIIAKTIKLNLNKIDSRTSWSSYIENYI